MGILNPNPEQNERREIGRWLTATLGGASFICALTVIGAQISSELAHFAVRAFAGGIPLLTFHAIVTSEHGRYNVSWLCRWLPVFGVFFCLLGVDMVAWNYDATAGCIALLISFGSLYLVMTSEDRAKLEAAGTMPSKSRQISKEQASM